MAPEPAVGGDGAAGFVLKRRMDPTRNGSGEAGEEEGLLDGGGVVDVVAGRSGFVNDGGGAVLTGLTVECFDAGVWVREWLPSRGAYPELVRVSVGVADARTGRTTVAQRTVRWAWVGGGVGAGAAVPAGGAVNGPGRGDGGRGDG